MPRRVSIDVLSHGHISPDMSATTEGKKSRGAAYDRVPRRQVNS